MKSFMLNLIILLVAIWLGLKVASDPGYAFLAWHHWTVQMPLWLMTIFIMVTFLLLSMIGKLWRLTEWTIHSIAQYFQTRHVRQAQKLTSRGLLDLAEGKWQQAEKCLIKAAKYTPSPLINYLAAARSAQGQGAYERRDDYLHAAHTCAPFAEMAVGLTQAQLQLASKQLEYGLATLKHLQTLEPHHSYVLKMLKKLYQELNDWNSLLELLPELKKRKVVSAQEFALLQKQCCRARLESIVKQSPEKLIETWTQLPKELKHDKELVMIYAKGLMAQNKNTLSEVLLRDAIRYQWDSELVALYGCVNSDNPIKQLDVAEAWLKQQGQSVNLLLTLGRLCVRNQLWGKAKNYLETCLEMGSLPEAWLQLGQLLEKTGESQRALDAYKRGLLTAAS